MDVHISVLGQSPGSLESPCTTPWLRRFSMRLRPFLSTIRSGPQRLNTKPQARCVACHVGLSPAQCRANRMRFGARCSWHSGLGLICCAVEGGAECQCPFRSVKFSRARVHGQGCGTRPCESSHRTGDLRQRDRGCHRLVLGVMGVAERRRLAGSRRRCRRCSITDPGSGI